ncbi:RraA family protein, partial [Methanobrevibacter sp.]
KINLDNISIEDIRFNGSNYEEYINLQSLLENVSSCQISDAFNGISRRSGVIQSIKPINNQKVWGSIFTAETNCDDWGTSALAIDAASDGDILFFKVDSEDMAIWGELASTCARDNGIKATVIYGSARDLDALLYMDYPVFASNFCPNAGSALGLGSLNQTVNVEDVEINPGDFLFGDENGIVIIPKQLFKQTMIATLGVKVKEANIINLIDDGLTLAQIAGLAKKQ